jgi:hypothetical protein
MNVAVVNCLAYTYPVACMLRGGGAPSTRFERGRLRLVSRQDESDVRRKDTLSLLSRSKVTSRMGNIQHGRKARFCDVSLRFRSTPISFHVTNRQSKVRNAEGFIWGQRCVVWIGFTRSGDGPMKYNGPYSSRSGDPSHIQPSYKT